VSGDGRRTITIEPDAVAVLAQRLVRRLEREDLLAITLHRAQDRHRRRYLEAVTEALADELHQDVLDGMTGGGSKGCHPPRKARP
jgi:hypothetical protein